MNGLDLLSQLSIIRDPRQAWKIEHKLSDILFLTIAAVIGGAEGWEEIEDFGIDHLEWLKTYGDFESGIPAHDTIARVISMISAKRLQSFFATWMKECHEVTKGDVIAIDGKTIKGSYDKSKRKGLIHMVSAFSAANQVVLGQVKTSEKSNEITAIPELLKLLNSSGCLVTIDAIGCQKKIASKILSKDANYVLAVKGNQGRLEQAFNDYFHFYLTKAPDADTYSTQEKGHGRKETRFSFVTQDTSVLGDIALEWPELTTIGIVGSVRQVGDVIPQNITLKYYISSAKLNAKELLEATRSHWSIEVQLHWRLDVGMNEDRCRIVRGEGGENLSVVRHIALNLLNTDKSFKAGLKRKQTKAGRNNEYLSRILAERGSS